MGAASVAAAEGEACRSQKADIRAITNVTRLKLACRDLHL